MPYRSSLLAAVTMPKPINLVWPGAPYPRGATWDGEGVNFALFSAHADRVELCVFDASGRRELQRIDVPERTDQIWHCYLPEARPGMLYGYRVHGPYRPEEGHRFNPHKLLVEPYAKHLSGTLRWSDAHFGYRIGNRHEDLSMDRRDNARGTLKCRVVDPAFSWGDDRPPEVPWHEMVIYELHVRGFTIAHPEVPQQLRGTYAGLATVPVVEYLRRLGVTTVELMPVHTFVDDRHLTERGLRNYWGYNSLGFFAPDMRYSATGRISEFKTLVRTLHSAGIEVILDVVYNHTAEGSHLGPTLCYRGVDNASYYRLVGDNPRYYMDFTGCGNTLNFENSRVLQMLMDSLRYWVLEMHVDGFRFDLAAALARELHAVNPFGTFFDVICQDPVLSKVKLIAEPWDVADGGYQVGNFPMGWSEWNDKYRDTIRRYWKGDGGVIGEFARRITGSSDLYQTGGRKPQASINYVTAHDGFTLHDLVSYDNKHNDANQEGNGDGTNNNQSWNCGAEGETDDRGINVLRERQKRNLLATLLLSQGVPMLLAGDETGRTQQGNNNAYCQDNAISWHDWDITPEREALLDFVRRIIALRRQHRVFRRKHFFALRPAQNDSAHDIVWLRPDGQEMTQSEWDQESTRCLGVYLDGSALRETDRRGRPIDDHTFLLLMNAHHKPVPFRLPRFKPATTWAPIVDTSSQEAPRPDHDFPKDEYYPLEGRSLALLRERHPGEEAVKESIDGVVRDAV
jgi:glycogen operon protein